MTRPFLLTLEYPPQLGGVAKYLAGEVKASPVPVVVARVSGSGWLSLIWSERRRFVGPPPNPLLGTGGGTEAENTSPPVREERGPRGGGCDYLWISHILPMGYVALVWKWLYKTPYRVYLHGLDLVRPRTSPWKRFWVKKILTNADEIVVNSQATAQLLNYYKINPDCARVQYPRIEKIDVEQYKPIAEKLRQQYRINDKPILLTVSRLVKRKGIDLVIQSLSVVWRQIPDLVFVVVGEGEERENLERIKKDVIISEMDSIAPQDAGLQNDKIIFTGAVSEEEKYGWLSAGDCFILTPTLDPNDFEGYGIVYKEAQMFGKPVIGSRVGGVPEAIGENGALVEPGNLEQITDAIIQHVKT